jgi:vesicle transport protein SEC22
MVRLTMIARISDGLPLAEGLDRDEDPELRQYDYKSQAKASAGSSRDSKHERCSCIWCRCMHS